MTMLVATTGLKGFGRKTRYGNGNVSENGVHLIIRNIVDLR